MKESSNLKSDTGAIALTMEGSKIIEKFLYYIQYFILWKKYRKSLSKEERTLAAKVVHVRIQIGENLFFSQSSPIAKIENVSPAELKSWGRIYKIPTFDITRTFEILLSINAYDIVNNKVKRKYDYLQFLSYVVNVMLWCIVPKWWGKEKITIFNLPGGRGVCSSTGTEILRESAQDSLVFFPEYDTSMVFPFLFLISPLWRNDDANPI
jgi:hypothetical protein